MNNGPLKQARDSQYSPCHQQRQQGNNPNVISIPDHSLFSGYGYQKQHMLSQ